MPKKRSRPSSFPKPPPDHEVSFVPTIHNVISVSHLGCDLNLRELAKRARNAEYNPQSFHGLFLRIREPKTTSLIFSSGKMVCAGAKTLKEAIIAARKHARIVQKYFPSVNFQGFEIHNIVGSWRVNFPLWLCKLEHYRVGPDAEIRYHPESFPGLYYVSKKHGATISIFSTGKVCIIGAKNKEVLPLVLKEVYPILKKCRKLF